MLLMASNHELYCKHNIIMHVHIQMHIVKNTVLDLCITGLFSTVTMG